MKKPPSTVAYYFSKKFIFWYSPWLQSSKGPFPAENDHMNRLICIYFTKLSNQAIIATAIQSLYYQPSTYFPIKLRLMNL